MKRIYAWMTLLFSFVLVFGMVGCGKESATDEMTIDKLFESGYAVNASSGRETGWAAYFTKDSDWTTSYLVEIKMTPEEVDEIYTVVSDEALQELLSAKKDVTITDMSDKVPAADAFQKYVGKTLSDLEAEEYYVDGSTEGDDGYVIVTCTKSGEYMLNITLDQEMTFDEFNSDGVDYSALTVKEAMFNGFAPTY